MKERELFRQYICGYCINEKNRMCYAPEYCNRSCKTIKCKHFRKKNIERKKYSDYIRYTYYDELGYYIAIVKRNIPENVLARFRKVYDEVKFNEYAE